MMQFTKATRKQARARIAIDGPSGAGKTYTSLIAATALANGGKIAVIDTERGSASLYSDEFEFDVLELSEFSPATYTAAIEAAGQAGYSVIVIDSLTHAWEGEGGALDQVDKAAARLQGNSYAAWKDVTPMHRRMVDAMLQSKAHVIVTMRSKMDYVQEKDDRGKTQIRKVGMAPIQRQGMEYEFTLVADMDIDHRIIVSKSRCKVMADAVTLKPTVQFWTPFVQWLNSGEAAGDNGHKREHEILSELGYQPEPEEVVIPKERPYPPAALRKVIATKAATHKANGKAISAGARGLMVGLLDGLFEGDEETKTNKRHQLLVFLTGEGSSKNIPAEYANAILDWMQYDQGIASKEAEAVVVSMGVAAGQESLL